MQSLKRDIRSVLNVFPKLHYSIKKHVHSLTGEIDLFDESGQFYIDSFSIKILIPKYYPYQFPFFFELDGKIERIADRHINPDNSCCVCSLQEASVLASKGISIFDYIKEYVIPFLANQIHYDRTKKWANGEYKHGIDGIIQVYQELSKISDKEQILKDLENSIYLKHGRNELCFCNSKVKYKNCHLKYFETFNKIPINRRKTDYRLMKQHIGVLA